MITYFYWFYRNMLLLETLEAIRFILASSPVFITGWADGGCSERFIPGGHTSIWTEAILGQITTLQTFLENSHFL